MDRKLGPIYWQERIEVITDDLAAARRRMGTGTANLDVVALRDYQQWLKDQLRRVQLERMLA